DEPAWRERTSTEFLDNNPHLAFANQDCPQHQRSDGQQAESGSSRKPQQNRGKLTEQDHRFHTLLRYAAWHANPKTDGRIPKEIRIPKSDSQGLGSAFGLLSDFDLRPSEIAIPPCDYWHWENMGVPPSGILEDSPFHLPARLADGLGPG